jgi:hypothetical protein
VAAVEGDVAGAEGDAAVVEEDVAVVEGDLAQAAASATTADTSAAGTIHPPLLFDGPRRTVGRRACLAMVGNGAESGEDAGADPAPPELPATGGPDVTLETGRPGRVSCWLVGS